MRNCDKDSYGLECNYKEETKNYTNESYNFLNNKQDDLTNTVKLILNKALISEKPSMIIKEYKDTIFKVIPELRICDGFEQNNDYHIYDVFEHTLHVVDGVENNYILRIAALFHDIGKPITFSKDKDGVGHFYNHWSESTEIFNKYKKLFNLKEEEIILIKKLIYYHDLNISISNLDVFRRNFNDKLNLLISLKIADINAQNSKYNNRLEDLDKSYKLLKRRK